MHFIFKFSIVLAALWPQTRAWHTNDELTRPLYTIKDGTFDDGIEMTVEKKVPIDFAVSNLTRYSIKLTYNKAYDYNTDNEVRIAIYWHDISKNYRERVTFYGEIDDRDFKYLTQFQDNNPYGPSIQQYDNRYTTSLPKSDPLLTKSLIVG